MTPENQATEFHWNARRNLNGSGSAGKVSDQQFAGAASIFIKV
jgi:hypothetical protein